MRNPVFFKSNGGNQYFFETNKKLLHYCSDSLKEIIETNGKEFIQKNFNNSQKENYDFELYNNMKAQGYFIQQKRVNNDVLITRNHILDAISNINQLTFETTEKCNLNCKYCSYGNLYNDYSKRTNKDMSFDSAKVIIDYFKEFWDNKANKSINGLIFISFYGGEPLINFNFIKNTVDYIKSLNIKRQIQFSITTNAILINKYIDFLVENNFNILISIDGDKTNNSYRTFSNGKHSFDKLRKNIINIKEKYPIYFEKRVNFNSVIHNRNSVAEVHDYIAVEFGKTSNISEIRSTGIHPEKLNEFKRLFNSVNKSLNESNNKESIINDNFIKLSTIENLALFLHKYGGYNYQDYSNIKEKTIPLQKTPSGTCVPFSKKVFITVNGLLLPCENVDHKYHLGKIVLGKVEINLEEIVSFYKRKFAKLKNKCDKCYLNEACALCMYNMDIDLDGDFICKSSVGLEAFKKYLSAQISKIEESPYLYERVMKNVSIE
mgnify:CR=1 FL=1|jgi:uncharacterized protein